MDPTRTIPELKSSFLRAQVRILSESLEAPEDWKQYATDPENDELTDKVVGDALQKCTVTLGFQLFPFPSGLYSMGDAARIT